MTGHFMAGLVAFTSTGLLLLACAAPDPSRGAGGTPEVELRVDQAAASPGGEATITLVNHSASEIGYNLCPAVLDRRSGGEWSEEPLRPAEVCTMELRILAPGESAEYRHTIPPGIREGEYRFRVGVEAPLGGDRVEVASGAFRIDR
jgi:hypothetical protein